MSWYDAIERNDVDAIIDLLGSFVFDVNEQNDEGWTPLAYAIENGNVTITKVLLQRGADPHLNFFKFRPKNIVSVDDMSEEILSVLLDKEKDQNKIKWSPLTYAILKENSEIVQLIVEYFGNKKMVVDLRNQGMEYLPACMAFLPDSVELKLEGNPLSFVPNVVKEGCASMLQYVRDVEMSGKSVWNKAKIMVLGKEGVGKTHLYHRMRGLKYERNLSTNGVDVNEFGLNGMELTWFDFGGQEVFYPTHQFFLTAQCVYLLVFRLDDKEYKERVEYWLQNIRNYCVSNKPAKVVVIGSYADCVNEKKEEKIWNELAPVMRENGGVVAYLSVSNKTGKGIDLVVTAITRALEAGKLGECQVPNYYLDVGQFIKQTTLKKIYWEAFVKEFPRLKALQIKWAVTFLANMGLCLFSSDLGIIVTDLQWLASMFKALITFVGGVVVDGIVTLSKLKQVWVNASNPEIYENMLLLEQFHIAFHKVDDGYWIIPCMMSDRRKQSAVSGFLSVPLSLSNTPRISPQSSKLIMKYERVFKLDIVPPGLMGRLTVRMQGQSNVRIKEMWKNGMLLETEKGDEEGEVLLSGYEIVIRCAADVNKQYLIQKTSEEMQALLKCMFAKEYKAPFEQFVVCPHCLMKDPGAEKTLLKYEECVRLISTNEQYFQCKGCNLPVSLLGSDLTFSYLKVYEAQDIRVEEKPFASGGYGDVYKAYVRDQVVVVKELKSKNVGEGFVEFQHEVSMMNKLQHDNLVQLFGIMLNPLRMVMELCEDGDLLNAIRNGRLGENQMDCYWKHKARQPPSELGQRIVLDIAKGMRYLHSLNPPIAHRDLRSPNVLLCSVNATVCAKVADFGLSTGVSEGLQQGLTTWQWISPEAQQGNFYSHRCDLYSFAIVAFEIFRGKSSEGPFGEYFAENLQEMEIKQAILHKSLRPHIPSNVETWMQILIEEMWQHDPQLRPSFEECVSRIESKGTAKIFPKKESVNVQCRKVLDESEELVSSMSESGKGQVFVGFNSGALKIYLPSNLMEHRVEQPHKDSITNVLSCAGSIWTGASDGSVQTMVQELMDKEKKRRSSFILRMKHRSLEKRSSKTLGNAKHSVIAIVEVEGLVMVGFSSGKLNVYRSGDGLLGVQGQVGQAITAMIAVDQRVFVGSTTQLYIIECSRSLELSISPIPHTQSIQNVTSFAYSGYEELWCATTEGEITIWNTHKIATLNGSPLIVGGSYDLICLWDVFKHVQLKILNMPKPGKVNCVIAVGIDSLWTSIDNGRALYSWEFLNFSPL